jgi:iron complex outermembrane receptor protein
MRNTVEPGSHNFGACDKPSQQLFGLYLACVVLAAWRVPAATAQTAAAGSREGAEAIGLQEIVVTATRMTENVNRVPESIVVFDAASLDARGIRSAADLLSIAPGVDLKTLGGVQTNISIRGISNSSGDVVTGAATAGLYLDDTPVQIRSSGDGGGDSLPDVFDLERVEVLRGPQGTLFGSGSEGGAIRFISVEPSLQTVSGYRRAEVGFTRDGGASYELGAAQGGPIVDGVLGFRVSAHDRHDGGFIDRVPFPMGAGPQPAEANANYSDTKSARVALLWSPSENLKITPSIYFRETDINDISNYWTALSDRSSTRYISGNGQNSPDTNKSYLVSAKLDWTRGPMELISTTSYYDRRETNLSDQRVLITNSFGGVSTPPQNPFPVFATPGYYDNGLTKNTQSNWTQEVRLQSANSEARLTWVGGIFLADNRQLSYSDNRAPFFDLESGVPNASETLFGMPLLDGQYLVWEQIITHDKQAAAFGEVNFNVTSHLKATVGLRAARTELQFLDTRDGPLAGGPGQDSGKHFETPKTPKYVLTYQFDPDDMVYGSVSNGFRIGGVNQDVSGILCAQELTALGFGTTAPKTYNSDRVRNFEVGLKTQPSERFRMAASVYYIDWFDIIQPVDVVSCGRTFTTNLGKAVSKGADFQMTFAATAQVLLDLMINYNDAKFTQTVRNPTASADVVKEGWTLGQTPWTIVGSEEYKFTGPFGWDSYLQGDVAYHSKNNGVTSITDPTSANYNPLVRPDGSTLDVRLRLGVQLSGWDVSLFVNNATNNHPLLTYRNDSPGGAIAYAAPLRPLSVGITMQSRF